MFLDSLRKRVLFALVCLSILPLAAAAYQGYHCGRMAVNDLMRLHVISVLEARRSMIAHWLDERVQDISALVHQPILAGNIAQLQEGPDPLARAVLDGILVSVQAFEAPFEGITLFDANWAVIASTSHTGHESAEFAEESFRQGVIASEGVYFGAPHAHANQEVGTHVGSKILSAEGQVLGYIVANLSLTRSLTPILQDRSGLWHTGKSFLLDSGGNLLTEPHPEHDTCVATRRAVPDQLDLSATPDIDVRAYLDFDGAEVMGAAAKLPMEGWVLVVEIDKDEASRWVDTLLFRVTILVGVAFLVVLLASTWLSAQLGRPLARLAAVAHRVSAGHTGERVGPLQIVEGEEVRRAFNQMLDELREKEEALVRSATLATVGELTSSVVHEMRNPLSSIKMNLQSLMSAGIDDEQNQELAQIAFDQTWRLESMLNELLQYGRPLTLNREAVTVSDLIGVAVVSVEGRSLEKQVRVNTRLDAPGVVIAVDVEQFRRALTNLIENAIDASPRGEKVDIYTEPSASFPGGLRIVVEDRGHGISANQLEKLFKPFFTTKNNGIGLGLANVKKIISMHGGIVTAANGEGAGARFQIDIPASDEPGDE